MMKTSSFKQSNRGRRSGQEPLLAPMPSSRCLRRTDPDCHTSAQSCLIECFGDALSREPMKQFTIANLLNRLAMERRANLPFCCRMFFADAIQISASHSSQFLNKTVALAGFETARIKMKEEDQCHSI